MPFRLVGSVNERPVSLLLRQGRNLIGSAAECDIVLEHPTISRRHAEVLVAGEDVEIGDLESRNGTFIGSRKISARARIGPGTPVAFGRVGLQLEWVAEGDVEAGLSFAGPSSASAQGERPAEAGPSTIGTKPVDAFATEDFPRLLSALSEGADVAHMIEAGGWVLFNRLPAIAVEVTSGAGEQIGMFFEARREAPPVAEPSEVVCGDDDLRVRVVFPQATMSRVFRPLVESVATLIRLANGRAKPAGAPIASTPLPMPEPATVVDEVQRIYTEAARVAQGDVGALIGGESGTGKEVLARYIHSASRRAAGPFVALNCAALPRDLLEAELLGIEKGVATGVEPRAGKFELANGGSLFLDEIGDMALETQARILRVLQEGEVYRIGGKVPRKADVRILSATNRKLDELLTGGCFREDLYYRIATWVVELPPLRQRRADIPNLAAHFLSHEGARRGIRVKGISRAALDVLMVYPWPGNIRQLENEMARAVLFLADGDLLDTTRLSDALRQTPLDSSRATLSQILEQVERKEILKAVRSSNGDVAAAAERLGLGRSTLYRRMKELGIEFPTP